MRVKKGLDPLPEQTTEEEFELLPIHLFWIWEAFTHLSRTRLVNQNGPQPIPISEIKYYCDLEAISDEESRSDLLFHITLLDIEWLKLRYKEIEKGHEKRQKEMEKKRNSRGRR